MAEKNDNCSTWFVPLFTCSHDSGVDKRTKICPAVLKLISFEIAGYIYLRVRDCCECFVYKYTHELNVQWTKNFCSIQNFEFIVHSASACICKQNTNLTVSNTFNIYLSSLVVLASRSRTLSLPKQSKTNPILKTLYVKKVQQIWRIVANKIYKLSQANKHNDTSKNSLLNELSCDSSQTKKWE